jgi:transcriptional repressor NrdR
MRCPYCQHHDSKVLDTSHDSHGGIRRRRECFKCGQRFSTYERPILATPLIVKQDGTREEFDLVINGLKEMDQIAYIRYAIVYLGLDDLHALRKEIDHLLES